MPLNPALMAYEVFTISGCNHGNLLLSPSSFSLTRSMEKLYLVIPKLHLSSQVVPSFLSCETTVPPTHSPLPNLTLLVPTRS